MSKQPIDVFEVYGKKMVRIARKISDLNEKEEGLPRPPACELRHAAVLALSAVISMVTIILRRA